jgi:hypothetical protein
VFETQHISKEVTQVHENWKKCYIRVVNTDNYGQISQLDTFHYSIQCITRFHRMSYCLMLQRLCGRKAQNTFQTPLLCVGKVLRK